MDVPLDQQQGNEELWRTIFLDGHPALLKQHWLHRKLPHKPRCKLCMVPFEGIGGWIMRLRGKTRNSRNPHFCNACDKFLESFPGGAEIEMSMLYVDIRHSTEWAEGHLPAEVSRRINDFLNQAIEIITDRDGFILAFYGDCIVAAWPPGFCGENHGLKAQQAAVALARNKIIARVTGEDIPVGIGVHTGNIYISTVTAMQGTFRDISIFGSNVNLAARLASMAEASQVLGSAANIAAAGGNPEDFPHRAAEVKGFAEPVEVYTIA